MTKAIGINSLPQRNYRLPTTRQLGLHRNNMLQLSTFSQVLCKRGFNQTIGDLRACVRCFNAVGSGTEEREGFICLQPRWICGVENLLHSSTMWKPPQVFGPDDTSHSAVCRRTPITNTMLRNCMRLEFQSLSG